MFIVAVYHRTHVLVKGNLGSVGVTAVVWFFEAELWGGVGTAVGQEIV